MPIFFPSIPIYIEITTITFGISIIEAHVSDQNVLTYLMAKQLIELLNCLIYLMSNMRYTFFKAYYVKTIQNHDGDMFEYSLAHLFSVKFNGKLF